MTKHIATIGLIAVLAASLLPAYTSGGTMQMVHAQEPKTEVRIDGAGASFAFPLMDLWRVKYAEINPHIELNYQSIGSGGGVKQHIEKTVNFAASDAPLKDSEYERAPGSITIPEMIGAIAIAYNLPGIDSGLNISEEALCGIYLGEITNWNDPKIAEHNPGVELPDTSIFAAWRSDGSGTTFAFTSYLTKVCPQWDEEIGAAKSVPWPTGRGAPGNEGVAGLVKSTEGGIGYITLAYAFQVDITSAAIQNGDKTDFVLPTLESASEASSGAATTLPAAHESWRGVDLLAAPGANSYPITSFSYVILHPELDGSVRDLNHAKEVANLIAWIITDGQAYNADLLYVPISAPIQNIGLEGLAKITYQGEPVYTGPTSVTEQPESQQSSDMQDEEARDDDDDDGGAAPEARDVKDGGGCLIATAAFGSELEPRVQFMREIRDGTVDSTQSGAAFLSSFNTIYYSFSPAVADMEREHPAFREAVRALITPMITSLYIMSMADPGSELDVVMYGSVVIALNAAMYVAAPLAAGAFLLVRVRPAAARMIRLRGATLWRRP